MKRTALAIMVLVFAVAQPGLADSVKNFNIKQVQISFNVNIDGDNMGFGFTGPNSNLAGGGGTACDYCAYTQSFAPGDTVNLSVSEIFYSFFNTVKLGGKTYDSELTTLFTSSISAPTITFPAGPGVSITVPATFDSVVSGSAGQDPNFINFNLHTPSNGQLTVFFSWDPGSGLYTFASASFVSATTVQEPATVSFMMLGLSAIIGLVRKKFVR